VDAAVDRYGNRPSDEAKRYNFDRGIWLLCGKESLSLSAGMPTPTISTSTVAAVKQPESIVVKVSKYPVGKSSPVSPKPSAQNDSSVTISKQGNLVAAALEDMRSQGSKAQFLLPSLLCSAVSSGAGARQREMFCMVYY
jgi:hypothetical protein